MSAGTVARPAMAPDDRVAYSLGEAAVMLGKSPRTLKRLYLAGDMPARRLGRTLMVPAYWLAEFAGSAEGGAA